MTLGKWKIQEIIAVRCRTQENNNHPLSIFVVYLDGHYATSHSLVHHGEGLVKQQITAYYSYTTMLTLIDMSKLMTYIAMICNYTTAK